MSRRAMMVGTAALVMLAAGATAWRAWRPGSPPTSDRPLAVAEIASQVRGGRPVIFLGFDGADWNLIDGYLDRGLMPNLKRLVDTGATGRIQTLQPALSPLIWTTMMTGLSPLEHGILDFVQFDPSTGIKEPIGSTERRAPALWNMANAAGKTVGAFGMWATYPAEALQGVMVSDRLFTFLFKEDTPPEHVVSPATEERWARDTLARAEREIGYEAVKAYLPWLDEAQYREVADTANPYGNPISALRRVLIETRVYRDLSLDWIGRTRPDLAIVYFQGTDTVGHVFAPYAPPRQMEINQRDYDRYRDVPEKYFQAIDGIVGEYTQMAERNGAVLMIAADHGFSWGEGRPTSLSSVASATAARWHEPSGIYVLHGPGVPVTQGHQITGNVKDVCATVMALLGMPPSRDIDDALIGDVQQTGAPHVDYFSHFERTSATVAATVAAAPTSTVSQDALANLRSLGYIGTGESTAAPAGARGSTRSPGSYNNEGVIHKGLGKFPKAMEAFERALALDPNLVSAKWNLSDLLYAQGQDLDRADRLLQEAFVGGLPDANRFLIGRAIAYQRGGRVERSLALVDAALRARDSDPELWLFRGRYRVEAGNCRGGVSDFERAATLSPDDPAAHASLGLARMCVGDQRGARAAFERSLRLNPDQPTLREYLAKIGS